MRGGDTLAATVPSAGWSLLPCFLPGRLRSPSAAFDLAPFAGETKVGAGPGSVGETNAFGGVEAAAFGGVDSFTAAVTAAAVALMIAAAVDVATAVLLLLLLLLLLWYALVLGKEGRYSSSLLLSVEAMLLALCGEGDRRFGCGFGKANAGRRSQQQRYQAAGQANTTGKR